jgi:hypothetical protein
MPIKVKLKGRTTNRMPLPGLGPDWLHEFCFGFGGHNASIVAKKFTGYCNKQIPPGHTG